DRGAGEFAYGQDRGKHLPRAPVGDLRGEVRRSPDRLPRVSGRRVAFFLHDTILHPSGFAPETRCGFVVERTHVDRGDHSERRPSGRTAQNPKNCWTSPTNSTEKAMYRAGDLMGTPALTPWPVSPRPGDGWW